MTTKNKVDEVFLNSYLYCALWSSNQDNGIPLDYNYDILDFAQEAVEKSIDDCGKFLELAENYISHDVDLEQVGYDFWFTRNRHGSGFWDCEDIYGKFNAQKLTEIAHTFGELNVYVGDNRKLYYE